MYNRPVRLLMTTIGMLCTFAGCLDRHPIPEKVDLPSNVQLEKHCRDAIGLPRVEQLADDLFVAIGYDLANTILVRTDVGNIVVDPGMSPTRSRVIKAALHEVAPGPTTAIIFTHSHIDHIGGASVWQEPWTQIWATEPFRDHLLKQYGVFQRAEARRGARQFGKHIDLDNLPCSALGRRIDLDAALESGVRMPTHTFSGSTTVTFGDVSIELIEAHGETHDQLFAWIPELKALLPGDNYYQAFPNLYTIRGTSPRPVGDWIASLDEMRRRNAELLIPSHTIPVTGAERIADTLTAYRDGIQWVRDQVIRGANAGLPHDEIIASADLPPHLANRPELQELYGQVDWSAKAIYSNELGWFAEQPGALYAPPATVVIAREVAMMGGAAAMLEAAGAALDAGDARWALHLLDKLSVVENLASTDQEALKNLRIEVLQTVAADVANTNGRGYLLEYAWELAHGQEDRKAPVLDDALLASIPVDVFLKVMLSRLFAEQTLDVHESVRFEFTDTGDDFYLTVRRGVAELAVGEFLPGTPVPVAHVRTDTLTWKQLSLQMLSPLKAVASGRLKIVDGKIAFLRFIDRFDREL